MIKHVTIENIMTGARRRIDYVVPDPSDKPEVQEMYARHPPGQHIIVALGEHEHVIDGELPP